MKSALSTPARSSATLALCFMIALLEGLDLQSAGLAGPRIAREFALTTSQLGLAFGIGAFGLMPGAAIGGRLADRFGRKRVLMVSVALFGLFSLASALVWSFDSLLAARFFTGLGLGAAMPNLIALCSEAVSPARRSSAVGAMYCGMPFGAAGGSLVAMLATGDTQWRHIFYVGGFGPLIALPLLGAFLPESGLFRAAVNSLSTVRRSAGAWRGLFSDGRASITVPLWFSYLFTLVILYFLMNWLPSLMVARGLSRADAGFMQMMFSIGGGLGALAIAVLMDRLDQRLMVVVMYAGVLTALWMLTHADVRFAMANAALLSGVFLTGTQSALYGLASRLYPTDIRGTGVGSAVAVGRLGSMLGPVVAGQLLSLGQSGTTLMAASIPLTLVAGLAAFSVVARPTVALRPAVGA